MEDTQPFPSMMNGQPYVAGRHAATLRRMLWREHMGLLHAQPLDASEDPNAQPPGDGDNEWEAGDEHDAMVGDPLNDELWDMWTSRATTNTKVRCFPRCQRLAQSGTLVRYVPACGRRAPGA
jgi:phospholipase D1/2